MGWKGPQRVRPRETDPVIAFASTPIARMTIWHGFYHLPDIGHLSLWTKRKCQVKIPQTAAVRFSLDETFDVGEDTGTPALEGYADRMPFKFTGELKRLVMVLQPQKLSEEEQRQLRQELARALMAVQ